MPTPSRKSLLLTLVVRGAALAAVIIALTASITADPGVRFKTWTAENGLPQNSVSGIAQTPDGYLWIATYDGLARFDGLRFKIFRKSDTPALPTNRLHFLTTDDVGRLWIFPEGSPQLVLYENGAFRSFSRGVDFDFEGVPESYTENGATVFTSNGTDFVYRDGSFTSRPALVMRRELGIDKDGTVWIDDDKNYYSIRGTDVSVHPRHSDNPLVRGETLPLGSVLSQLDERTPEYGSIGKTGYARRGDAFWFFLPPGHRDMAPDLLNPRNTLARLRDGELDVSNFDQGWVHGLIIDRSGNLWMNHAGDGLLRLDAASMDADDLSDLKVEKIGQGIVRARNSFTRSFRDRQGNIWIGGYEGLQLLKDDPLIDVLSKTDGLMSDNIYAVSEDPGGEIWFGSWETSIARYANGKVDTFALNLVTAFTNLRSGRMVIGGNGYLWTRNQDRFEELALEGFGKDPAGHRPVQEIRFVAEDRTGDLWIGGSQGLLRYRNGAPTRYSEADGLPAESLVAFLQTRSGDIWVGTTAGLARLDGDRFTPFTKADGLGGEFVRSLYEDRSGTLWIGTYDSGIIRYKDGIFRTIDSSNGLFSDGVFCILEDDDGWFWINSNQGIYRVRVQDLNDVADGLASTVVSAGYGIEDGLVNVEGNGGKQPAGLRSSDGRLWFPTAGGLAVIDPKRVHRDETAPPVLIEEVKVDQQEVAPPNGELVLAPGQTALEINYTGITFSNPDRLRFRYRLEGLEDNWTEAGTRRTAYFSHLPFGEYVFRVTAANRDGVWNETGAAISIVIDRPYFRTYWFYALVSTLAVLFLGLVYFTRLRQVRSIADARELYARQLLESQEHERSRLAMELHDSLGQSLVVIRNRALLGISRRSDGEAMFGQLQEISDASAAALQETREIAHTLHPYQIEALGLPTALLSLIDKLDGSSAIKFEVNIDVKMPDVAHNVGIAVYRIAQEWLTNVLKHASAEYVSISMRSEGDVLTLQIRDDGVGFDTNTVTKSLGLNGIEERARMIGAMLEISSSPGSGASLKLSVQLK
jgi:signal transduction histidine kinase/ligand-binding sensor domain-containing protein